MKTYVKLVANNGVYSIHQKSLFNGWMNIYETEEKEKAEKSIEKLSKCDNIFIIKE